MIPGFELYNRTASLLFRPLMLVMIFGIGEVKWHPKTCVSESFRSTVTSLIVGGSGSSVLAADNLSADELDDFLQINSAVSFFIFDLI